MSHFKSIGIAKVIGTKSLETIDQKVTEGLLALHATTGEVQTETKMLIAGIGVTAFADEISSVASIFGIPIDPTIIQTTGNVLAVGSALSMANKTINNFNQIDISNMNVEDILKLLEDYEDEDDGIKGIENATNNKEL